MKSRVEISNKALRLLVLAAVAIVFSGCFSTRVGDFTCLSSKNIPVDFNVQGRASQKGARPYLLSIIPINGANRFDDAISDALHEEDGDALINIQIDYSYIAVPLIFAVDEYVVKADVVKTKTPKPKKRPLKINRKKPRLRFYSSP